MRKKLILGLKYFHKRQYLNVVLFSIYALLGCDARPNSFQVQQRLLLMKGELWEHHGMPVSSTGSEIAFVLMNEGKVITLVEFIKALNIEFETKQPLIDHWGNPIMVEIVEVIMEDRGVLCRLNIISKGDYPRTKEWRSSALSVLSLLELKFTNNVANGHSENLP